MDVVPIRAEVIEARRSRKAGAIILARPVPMKIAAACGAAVVAALGLELGFGEYTSKVHVTGQLMPAGGAIKVVATQFGRIIARHANEGDHVKAGQRLFDLSAERIGDAGSIDARIDASLATRREQLSQRRDAAIAQLQQRAHALADQQRLVQGELATHQGAITIQDELEKSTRGTFDSYNKLAEKGYVAPSMLAQYRNSLNIERAKRNALALALNNAERTLLQVRQEAATLAGQEAIARAEAEQSMAALEQEAAEHDGRSVIRISAPHDGVVTAFAYSIGQSVQSGAVLATVLPAGSALEAQVMVPSHAKASIERGQQVQLRIDAFPYQKYGLVPGTVQQVELNPINDGAMTGGAAATPMYRAIVKLPVDSMLVYGKRKPFESGMSLEADIFNDRRRLIEWVFDPLISAAKGRAP